MSRVDVRFIRLSKLKPRAPIRTRGPLVYVYVCLCVCIKFFI